MLSTTRRIKKGTGARHQSAKRQRFMELLARGWTTAAARREVGVTDLRSELVARVQGLPAR